MAKNNNDSGWIVALVVVFLLFLAAVSYVFMPFLPWFEERQAGQETIEVIGNGE